MKIKKFKPDSKYNFKAMLMWVAAFALIGVTALILTQAAPTASMSLSASTANVTTGSTVSVTVRVEAGTNEITGAQVCVAYDTTKLTLTSTNTSASPLPNAIPASSADCAAGQAQISRFGITPATGNFTLGVLTFTVTNAGTAPIALTIDSSKSYIRDNATTDDNGNYSNILTAPTGTTLTPPAAPPTPPPTPPTPVPTASMTISPTTGSVVNGSNISVTVQVVAGTNQITGAQACITYDTAKLTLASTDVSGSPLRNAIPTSSADCASGQAQIGRFDTTPATGTFTLGVLTFTARQSNTTAALAFDTAKSYVRDNATTDTGGNYTNILTNPTGSTLTLTAPVVTPPPTAASATMTLSPATGSVTNGQTIAMTVQVRAGTNQITGSQACISYDATKLILLNTDFSASPLRNAIPTSSADCAAGQAQLSRFDTTPATGNFTLGVLTFRALQGGTSAAINFDATRSYVRDNVTVDTNGNYANILTNTTGSTLTLAGVPAPPPTPVTVSSSITTGQTLSGNATWNAATTGSGITRVEFAIDNAVTLTDLTTPFQYNGSGVLDTTTLANGSHTLRVTAFTASGNVSETVSAIVQNGDETAPSTPGGLRATAPAYNRVTLTWTASTDNRGVTGYWIVRNGATVAQTAGTTYTDNAVVANTNYSYQVIAYDAAENNSAASTAATVKTPAVPVKDSEIPSTPTNLTATTASTAQINLNWIASTDNVRVSGYDVYRAKGTSEATKIATVTTTTFGDSGLSAASTYSYYVIARDSSSNSSAKSNTVTAKTAEATNTNGSLSGTVTGVNGRTPWTLITIQFNGKRHMYVTNSSGAYTIPNLPANTYTVKYYAFKYAITTLTITVPEGTRVVQNVTLVKR